MSISRDSPIEQVFEVVTFDHTFQQEGPIIEHDFGPSKPSSPRIADLSDSMLFKLSSQRAADLYDSGARMWRREDLLDIEQQLANSSSLEKFTVRCYDGSVVHIKNPGFGVAKPIWHPYVQFQDYWQLVHTRPEGPEETYLATYLVNWLNQTFRNYQGPIDNIASRFEDQQQIWESSAQCKAFKELLSTFFSSSSSKTRKVTKIICFGLGDINAKLISQCDRRLDPATSPLLQHAIALTMASVARHLEPSVRLLAQDPNYSAETKVFLHALGFEIVGDHGAGGFADVDDESVIIAPFVSAPVLQIVADLARPAVLIFREISPAGRVFVGVEKVGYWTPVSDPSSPRTKQMLTEYKSCKFPSMPTEERSNGVPTRLEDLDALEIYSRIQ